MDPRQRANAGLHTPIDTLLHEATRHTSEPTGGQLFPVGNDPPRVMGSRPMVFSPEPSALLRLAAICSALFWGQGRVERERHIG